MPYDARDVANLFIDRSMKNGGNLTHLKLQKILFFAHAWHLGKYGQPLVGQYFEAWQYGPVIRVVYDQLKHCGNRIIDVYLKRIDVNDGVMKVIGWNFDEELKDLLLNIYEYYERHNAGYLVELSHQAEGPWEKVWKKATEGAVVGMYIPDESIRSWILEQGGAVKLIRH